MTSKRRSKEWLKRSRASKKGWETRRKKAKLAAKAKKTQKILKNVKLGVPKKKRKSTVKLPKLTDKTPEELIEIIRRKDDEIRILKLTKDWPNAMPDEFISSLGDQHVTLEPSRARHLGAATKYMRKMLSKAYKEGENELRRIASQFARQLNLPLREIYTLHYSP